MNLYKFMKFAVEFVTKKATIDLNGVPFVVPRGLDLQTYKNIYFRRYEREEALAVRRYLSREQRVLEIGGGCGFVTSLIQHEFSPAKHVVVEPIPENCAAIEQQSASFRNGEFSVEMLQAAFVLGSPCGTSVEFHQASRRFGSGLAGEQGGSSGGKLINVSSVSEDSLGLDGFDLIVVDVEGYEEKILPKMLELTEAKIIFEYHAEKTRKELGSILGEMLTPYRFEHISGATFFLQRGER